MQRLVLFCAATSFVVATEAASAQGKAVPSGHSVFQSQQEIPLTVRFISVTDRKLATAELLPRAALQNHELTLPEVVEKDRIGEGGIRLVSSQAVVERPIPVYLSIVSKARTRQLVKQAQADGRSNVLFGPSMTLRDGEPSEISDVDSVSFVAGFRRQGEQLSPQVDTVESGTRLTVRPQIKADGTIRLDVGVRFSRLKSMTEFTDEATGKAVQVPEVDASIIKLSADIKSGQTLVIGGFERSRAGRSKADILSWIPGRNRSDPADAVKETILLMLTPELGDATARDPEVLDDNAQ